MATIVDVAKRAGVSTVTVSRVINEAPNVNVTTRARVEQAVRDSLPRLDQFTMELLAERMHAAEQAGDRQRMEQLQRVADALMPVIEESQPQEIRFINELLSTDYPAGTGALLEERRALVSEELLGLMELVEKDLAEENRAELASRLAQIRQQAAGFLS